MLDREILKTDYGVSYGSVTLKSLQNDNVPELDLLVREAIQNSSDASLKEGGSSYSVGFFTGNFEPVKFNALMTGIEHVLDKKFPQATASFLEIRDTKTSGLTGCIRKEEIKKDDHGNFFKLIYDTGKRQTLPNAGGNWGFGKSVYYRVGEGIVIFYSRIHTDNGYENRMIITLVEDESKTDQDGRDITILGSVEPRSAGKAWWGIREGDNLLPLTDAGIIQSILDVFNINPFKEDETGTSIIIPYINTKGLLEGIIPVEAEIQEDIREHFESVWASTLSDYLRLCIQKWYAPKIHNRELTKFCSHKWLLASVDNKPIRKQDLLPFFQLVQELYTTALARTYDYEYSSPYFPQIQTLPVNIMSYFENGQTAGYIAIAKVSKTELNGAGSFLSPYDYIGHFEADGGLNEPIMMYSRDPGMVIDYAITGAWVKNITPPDSAEEFLFAFFVPNTEKLIKHSLAVPEYAGMELGAYLRECEASDHMGWNDPVRMQIVQRIQRNSINQINKHIRRSDSDNVEAKVSKLSGRLGKSLLPKIGYGKKQPSGNSGSGGVGTKITNASLEITSQRIIGNEVEMDYILKLSHGKKDAAISIIIASEGGWIDADSWKEDIGIRFPIEYVEFGVDNIKTAVSDYPIEVNQQCKGGSDINTDELTVSMANDSGASIFSKARVVTSVLNPEIHGKIKLSSIDKKYRFSLKLE